MIPIYKIDEINHNNVYTYFKYFFLAPVALLRLIGLLITFGLSNYTAKYFPNIYTQFVNRVTIEVLPLQYPLKDETPKDFAERVRGIMAQALNVSTLN